MTDRNERNDEVETHYRTKRNAVRRAFRNQGHNANEADDMTQETYARAVKSFKPGGFIKAFISRIAENLHTDEARKYGRRGGFDQTEDAMDSDRQVGTEVRRPVEHDVERNQRKESLRRHLAALPDDQREALELIAQGYSPKEISELLNVPWATLRSRIARGEKTLRERMADKSDDVFK